MKSNCPIEAERQQILNPNEVANADQKKEALKIGLKVCKRAKLDRACELDQQAEWVRQDEPH